MKASGALPRLRRAVNQPGVYIEGGIFCMARVQEVEASSVGMRAILVSMPESPLVCYYRERPIRFAEESCPFGSRWEISKEWPSFFLDEDLYWFSENRNLAFEGVATV